MHPFRAPGVFMGMTTSSRALDELIDLAEGRASILGDAVVLDGLAKTYPDGTEAVRGISLRVAPGEAFGILGPNGAGKSTTIGMLGTLVKPTGGRARVAGFDVVAEPIEVRRRIGFAMQEVGVDDFATASELMVLQGRLHGLRKARGGQRAPGCCCASWGSSRLPAGASRRCRAGPSGASTWRRR